VNVVGCVGWTTEARQTLLSSLEPGMRPFEWLRVGRWEFESASILCAVNSLERVSIQESNGESRFYVGTGLPEAGQEGELFLRVSCRRDAARISVDPLGLFPLYYYSTADFLLFSSSLWPFGRHPLVSEQLDPEGLIGLLLTQSVVGGRTLLKGVSRLSAGSALTWARGRPAAEQAFNRVQPTSALHGRPFGDQLDAVDAAMQSAMRRCDAGTVLLSGGLDSRLVAGYEHRTRGTAVEAVSLGSAGEFDAEFAGQVARALGWGHLSIAVDMSRFARHAEVQVCHEQLAGSFWDLSFWQVATELRNADPALVTGFCGNNTLEPLRHDPRQTDFAFDGAFRACNKYGFSPQSLRTLLRLDRVEEQTAAVVAQLRKEYESYDCEPYQKVQMFDLTHRARFLVGMVAWRLSWGTRPRLPYADRDLLAAATALPIEAFRGRKLQRALLRHRFPELARLPLDTASFFTRPLMPSITDRVRHLGLLLYHGLVSRRERRYYHAVFDLNGPGWRSVRRDAEKGRSRAGLFFDSAELLRHLPPPDAPIAAAGAGFYQEGSRKKSLLAFLLWASQHPYDATASGGLRAPTSR
jgi:asparagine synthase (glutamine-hydrolysing)